MSDVDMAADPSPSPPGGNAEPYSVSELAFALKRTLEATYGFVRLRGELSKVTHHASGHVYLTLKDDKAAIDGVVWKGQVRALQCRPEQGLEVIVTGRITTYPASSKYQIVVESMEPAGIGALLAQLERLKARLADEGLFDPARKRPLPAMPAVIGVITSPTGAVIRDILHRIRDRWPCQVVVWPVVVQGEAAAGQVTRAIQGFNALTPDGPIARPDVIIVARGGGSVEDLWPFNDESLARAAAASIIPLISAVGHETDTTLIDFASDRRAPTPTAAAEMATPVLAELKAAVADYARRLAQCGGRMLEDRRSRLNATVRGLPRPADILALASQRFDIVAGRLSAALARNTEVHAQSLTRTSARFNRGLLERPSRLKAERLRELSQRFSLAAGRCPERAAQNARLPLLGRRLSAALERSLAGAGERLTQLDKLRLSLDPNRPLALGFALVHRPDGAIVRQGASLVAGETVTLQFADASRSAVIEGAAPARASPRARASAKPPTGGQGNLF